MYKHITRSFHLLQYKTFYISYESLVRKSSWNFEVLQKCRGCTSSCPATIIYARPHRRLERGFGDYLRQMRTFWLYGATFCHFTFYAMSLKARTLDPKMNLRLVTMIILIYMRGRSRVLIGRGAQKIMWAQAHRKRDARHPLPYNRGPWPWKFSGCLMLSLAIWGF